MLGLTGAHRAGKTTLAKLFSEKIGIPFVTLPPVVKQMGMTPGEIDNFEMRLKVQHAYLDEAEAAYKGQPTIFITDRTPLDLAAFLLGEVNQNMPQAHIDQTVAYVNRAVALTSTTFSSILHIPAVLPYEVHPDKPPMNAAYQMQFENLVRGLLLHPAMSAHYYLMAPHIIDLQDRFSVLMSVHERLCASIANAVVGMTRQ